MRTSSDGGSSIKVERQPREIEKKIREFVGSRKGIQVIVWTLSLLIIILLAVFVGANNDIGQ